MAQLLTRPPPHPTASFLGTSVDDSYHQLGDENPTGNRDHAQQEVEAQAYGHLGRPAANLRIRAAGSALSKSSSANPDGPDDRHEHEYQQPHRPQLTPREPDAVHVEPDSSPSFRPSSSGLQHFTPSGPMNVQRASAAAPTILHITNTTTPTTSATVALTSMATAAAGAPASRLPLQARPPSSVPTLDSLPPIQPLQDSDDDQLHDFSFHQFPTYSTGRGWLPYAGTYPHSTSAEPSFSAASSQPDNMSNQHAQPPGPPRLPGATGLGHSSSPPFPQSSNPNQGQSHYGYPSHGGGNTSEGSASHIGVSVGDLYRQPSVGEPMQHAQHSQHSQHSSHLPSMRTIDAPQPQPPHGMSLPGPALMQAAPSPYVSMLPPPYAMPPNMPTYGVPGQLREYHNYRMAPLGMSPVPRHKKEIKRRTKTGCMTCRKRRIKCDETHPTCNNCKKSKRECAGYDPVFRQQPQSPGALQTLAQSPASASSSGTAIYTSLPISPIAAAAATSSTASTLTAAKSSSVGAAPPVSSSSSTTSTSSIYAVTACSTSSSNSSLNTASAAYQPTAYVSRSILSPNQDWSYAPDSTGSVYRAKMKVDDIIGLAGSAPPVPTTQPTLETLDDITKMYFEIYVPGLTAFFETTWYNFKSSGTVNPVSNLLNNKNLVGLLSAFLSSIARVETADPNDANMMAASALETRIVWALAAMAYVTPATVNLPSEEPLSTDNATEARNRLSVIDTLLSGGCVRTNPCMPPPRGGNPARIREHQFWWWLAEYLRLQEDAGLHNTPGNSLPRLREQALARMRNLLDGHENRDIIYSIAILRHLAPRYSAASDMIVPPGHEDEADPRIKFAMATEFIRKQAQDHGAGLTNVGRRIADIGLQAFVQPGYSIRRA